MFAPNARHKGFTLIEVIAGIVILAVAMSAMTSIVFPQATRSVDPVYQVRAAELAQSLLNEIMGKAFDENTDYSSGTRCNEVAGRSCTTVGSLGTDTGETSASLYDDVDDYNGYDQTMAQLDSSSSYATLYTGFQFSVAVIYDDNYNGQYEVGVDTAQIAKRIDISVTTPGGQVFKFAGYKANF